MGDYWTLEGMLEDSSGKDKKKKKEKEKSKGEKKKSNNVKTEIKICQTEKLIPYEDFLRNKNMHGLYVIHSSFDDEKIETYIIKDEEFDFPRVVLTDKNFKIWLKEYMDDEGSTMNVNKVMYASTVKKIDIPKGLLKCLIKHSR